MSPLGWFHTASALVAVATGAAFWWAVVLASTAVLAAGAVLIRQRARITLAPFRRPVVPHSSKPAG